MKRWLSCSKAHWYSHPQNLRLSQNNCKQITCLAGADCRLILMWRVTPCVTASGDAWRRPPRSLQIAAHCLLTFNRFEQCFEIALAEAFCTLSLNDLKEQGWAIFHRFGEN